MANLLSRLAEADREEMSGNHNYKKYGKRHGSDDYKQAGYYGEIPLNNGRIATEYSIGQNINGQEVEMPSLIPTLTYEEMQQVKNSATTGAMLPQSVYKKAREHAMQRMAKGRSPFWGIPEIQQPMPVNNTFINSLYRQPSMFTTNMLANMAYED